VLIDWNREFDLQFDRLEQDETPLGKERYHIFLWLLKQVEDLAEPPTHDTATIKRVRQSRKHLVWRVAHPYREGIALRLICWFPPNTNTVVVALFAGDKARYGDVFYDSVGYRADRAIDLWIREQE